MSAPALEESGGMGILSFDQLWDKLRTGDESVEIEAKRSEEFGNSILETVSAFANEPGRGGGHLLLGVGVKTEALFPDYEVVGLPDPDQLQADLATKCREMLSIPIRPEMAVQQHDNKSVVVAFVPEARPGDKPVYIKRKGLPRGAFRRIGSTDQYCTDDDVAMFYQERGQRTYDETPIADSSLEDIDPRALHQYRRLRGESGGGADLLGYSDEDLLYALGATTQQRGQTCLTVAGLVLFGTVVSLRRHLPMTRVDYIRVEGREWVPDPEKRYESIDKLGPLMLTIPTLASQILDDIPKAFTLSEDGIHRKDVPLIPRHVIREALVNALMHRSYHKHQPVQIIRYTNRIEIRNSGYSLVPDERLGEPGSILRNPKIAAVLHDVGLAETKGTGIRAMREAMDRANLTQPLFESDRMGDRFTIRLLVHHLLSPEDWDWLGHFKEYSLTDDDARALIVTREIGAIDNAVYRSINRVDTLTASGHLRRLRDWGLLEQKGKAAGTYYLPTRRLLRPEEPQPAGRSMGPAMETTQSQGGGAAPPAQSQGLEPLPQGLEDLPQGLTDAAQALGVRASPAEVRPVIRRLCAWKPLRAEQIARILGRGKPYVIRTYLGPMVRDGELAHTFPDNPAHPRQAYRAASTDAPEDEP